MTDTIIPLADQAHLFEGKYRRIYQHPDFPGRIIKVNRPGNRDEQRAQGGGLKRYGVWRFGAYRCWAQDLDEYVAVTWRTQSLPRFFPQIFGFVSTDMGPGMVYERVMDAEGNTGPTLRQCIQSGQPDPRLHDLITQLFDALAESQAVISDVTTQNILVRGDYESLVVVDGLGETTPVKTSKYIPAIRRWKYTKQKQRLLDELARGA